MNPPLVSVVIPTYNYAHFVAEAVASVLAQTYRQFEVIVVDDGSTDNTPERLGPYMEQIRYIYQENQGLSAARNTGIKEAKGEFVAFLDSDDAWHPRKLELQMAYFAARPQASLVAAKEINDIRDGWGEHDVEATAADRIITLDDILIKSRFSPSSVVARKECFDAAGSFDVELRSVEDRDMWLRIADRFLVAKLEVPLCFSRLHGNSMSKAAARMESYEHLVLNRAFRNMPSLRRRSLFRLRVFSYAAYSAAHRYSAAGMHRVALRRMVRSFLLWPFPYRRRDVFSMFARGKFTVVAALRGIHLMSCERKTSAPARFENARPAALPETPQCV
jgi:glycosyltransferase involved in cell wall biosynthesis